MKKRINHIAIIGSTGLIGYEVTKKIIRKGDFKRITTASLNKNISKYHLNEKNHYFLDFNRSDSWRKILLKNPDIIVLISNCRHFLALKEAVETLKINPKNIKLIIVGTTGVFSPAQEYSNIYKYIEKEINLSKFKEYIILRPNLIYGSKRDKNINKVINFINKYKFFPSLSSGKGKIQPLYYKDLVDAILSCIYGKNINGSFNITGKECLNYYQFYGEIFTALELKTRIINVPYYLSINVARLLELIKGKDFIISVERIKRLREIKCFSNYDSLKKNLYKPTPFKKGIRNQVQELKKS